MHGVFRLPHSWPLPADEGAAARLIERFSALGRAEVRLAASAAGEALLRALGGNSPYLADLAVREAASLRLLAEQGPEAVEASAMGRLAAAEPAMARPALAALLRQAKREVALATAVADLGGLWRLERICAALSDLAEAALALATRHLLLAAHESGQLRLPDPSMPDRGSGFVVLGMGKLGARELNYSSDVDLVLLYDPDAAKTGEAGPGFVHARLARDLATLMEARDANGYVFRIDLRLRPDPAATPPAVALPAALAYYESMAQNWERAAMVKARPVAGDRALGAGFLEEIRPFVWRRHLDFAAIADIHAMRRRIDARVAAGRRQPAAAEGPFARLAGHNLKLGAGGIREIEFVAQTLELVWGGRDPSLRVPATLPALAALTRAGVLAPLAAKELAASYRFLRTVEHRLQMVADRQTHSLPETAEGVERFLRFLGGRDPERLATRLLGHLKRVEARYREMFEPVRETAKLPQALDLRGEDEPKPEAIEAFSSLGFANPARVAAVVQGWQTGRPRALRSERARELLFQLLPQLLAALGRQRDPDAALARFDEFLARLPAAVQLLSLFQRHPALLGRIAAVFGAAPSLSDYLARNPAALEGLLTPEAAGPEPARALAQGIKARLAPVQSLEEALVEIRSFVQTEGFRISVATLEARMDADTAGIARAALADATLAALLPRVLADFARRYGRVPRGRMAVVLLGKGGGREMMAGSDLDLMLIYDHPPEVSESRGARHLPASEWFIRAVHGFIAALSAPGPEGPAFAVDMRLRPSGNKGPVAVSLASFRRYHASDAWTWERMALTRARVVAGPRGFRAEVGEAIRAALAGAGPAEKIRADAAAMRARVARELPQAGPWDVRHRPGGLMEVEFIAQALQLIHAPARPALWHQTTRDAVAGLAQAGLIAEEEAALLLRADRLYRTVQGLLRVAIGRTPPESGALPEAVAAALLHAVRASGEAVLDVAGLIATLDERSRAVRGLFERHVGPVTLGQITGGSIEERKP